MTSAPAFTLRAPTLDDAAASLQVHCDPQTNRFRPGGAPDEATVQGYIPKWLDHWGEHGFGYWAVERNDGQVVGFGGIMHLQVGRHAGLNLYFRLHPDAWNLGLSSLIGRAALREAFEVRGFERVLGLVRPANLPSRRALEKLGMTPIDTFDDVPGEEHSLIYAVERSAYLAGARTPAEIATLNNVNWYQALFDAHGIPSETDELAWHSLAAPPPFHGNLVVRARDVNQADIEARMQRIADSRLPGSPLGLKDSYASLDLAPLGWQVMFNASWLWLTPVDAVAGDDGGLAWGRVATPAGLAEWNAAWADADANQMTGPAPPQFPDSLLRNPDFAFLAGRQQGRIVAGGVVNRSPGAAGISNFFNRSQPAGSIWPALARGAREAFPELPLTGYDRGESLQQALQAGFGKVGDLRVWYRPGAP